LLRDFILGRDPRTASLEHLRMLTHASEGANELNCLIEEYRALRAELVSRITIQYQLLNYSIVLIGASLPVATAIVDRKRYSVLLLFPLVFVCMGWLFLLNDWVIRLIANYLNVSLARQVEAILSRQRLDFQSIWQWELFQYEVYNNSISTRALYIVLGAARYGLSIIPAIASIAAYFLLVPSPRAALRGLDGVLLLIDGALLALLSAIAIITAIPGLAALHRQRRHSATLPDA
jgi:hypothetical protein